MSRKPRSERWLRRRDAKRDIGQELLESIRQIKAGDIGRVHLVPIPAKVPGASKGVLAHVRADRRFTDDESLQSAVDAEALGSLRALSASRLRRELTSVLRRGEHVAVTVRGRIVASLVPVSFDGLLAQIRTSTAGASSAVDDALAKVAESNERIEAMERRKGRPPGS
jgi:antitoxin (DNA-binding transcriptional repressor) of toxin-antitoxin stability system